MNPIVPMKFTTSTGANDRDLLGAAIPRLAYGAPPWLTPGSVVSPRYPGGLALRFARVKRYRPDKDPHHADVIETVRKVHEKAQA